MDANKLQVLKEINYTILNVCGLCRSGDFGAADWGTCGLFDYEHQKHSDSNRQLSIHKFGTCPKFKSIDLFSLGAFAQFKE